MQQLMKAIVATCEFWCDERKVFNKQMILQSFWI